MDTNQQSDSNPRPAIRSRKPLKSFGRNKLIIGRDINPLVDAVKPLMNLQIRRGSTDQIDLTDSNCVFQIGSFPNGGDGSSGGGAAQPFALQSVQSDYVTAWAWNGSTYASPDIYIAKPYPLRNSLTSETIFGTSHSYSYGAGPDGNNVYRTNSDGTNSESEIVVRPWIPGEVIYAIQAQTLVLDGSSNPIPWLLQDTRQWAKVSPIAVAPTTPATSSATTNGYTGGLILADANYIYVSIAANTWKRVAIATW